MFDGKTDYSGMTVNERLMVKGVLAEFDKAASKHDAKKIRSILRMVDVDEESISLTITKLGIESSS